MFLFLCFVLLLIWVVRLEGRLRTLERRDQERLRAIDLLEARLRRERGPAGAEAPPATPPPIPPGPAVPPRPVPARVDPATEPRAGAAPPRSQGEPTGWEPAARMPQPARVEETAAPAEREAAGAVPKARPEPARAATPAAPTRQPFDWEALVGVKLFSWVAGVAMALAAVFFLGYSIQSGWLQPPVRMAIGLVVGIGLLVVCELRVARRYAVTANAMDAAGLVILFSTFYASYARWHLVGPGVGFLLLILVTVLAVTLSIRRDSVLVALLGLVGGFSTPALLSTGQDNPIGLFGYLLLLNAGLAWVAYQKRWTPLVALSLVFTTLYQWSWAVRFLDPGRLPLAAGIFFIFPIIGVATLAALGRTGTGAAGDTFRRLTAANAALPLLFSLYMAVVPAYSVHYEVLFGFLFCLDAGLFAIAWWRGPQVLHVLGAASTVIVTFAWLGTTYGGRQPAPLLPATLGLITLFVLFYLGTGMAARRWPRGLDTTARLAAWAAPALLLAFPVLAAREPAFASPLAGFAVLLVLLVLVALYASIVGAALLYYAAAAVAVLSEAVWSGVHLDSTRLVPALAVYASFGLFFVLVPVLCSPRRREAGQPDVAGVSIPPDAMALALTGHMLLMTVAVRPSLSVPPWPMLTVLVAIDVALAAGALRLRRAGVHLVALALTQILLGAWLTTVTDAPWPTVAISGAVVVAAFGLACSRLARHPIEGTEIDLFDVSAITTTLLAQGVLILVPANHGGPPVALLVTFHLLLVAVLLALATWTPLRIVSVIAVAPVWLATTSWQAYRGAAYLGEQLGLALPLYLAFLVYPLLLGTRIGKRIEPHLAAVLASASFFQVARIRLTDAGYSSVIGLLPLAQALLLGGLLLALLRLERPGERALGRLALVSGGVLAFVTVAIPLQLHNEWITVGWALEGAALAWLFRRIPHRGLFWSTVALLLVVFARLALNPNVFYYEPRGALRIVNWYLYTYLLGAGSMLVASRMLSTTDDRLIGRLHAARVLPGMATVLLFLLLNIEIADFFSTGAGITFNLSAGLGQDLTYTLGWALFAVGLLAAGIWYRSHFARMAAIVLLTVTVLKAFLHDVARLGGLYRVFSFVGLAVSLSLVAVVLQRFVLQRREQAGREEAGR